MKNESLLFLFSGSSPGCCTIPEGKNDDAELDGGTTCGCCCCCGGMGWGMPGWGSGPLKKLENLDAPDPPPPGASPSFLGSLHMSNIRSTELDDGWLKKRELPALVCDDDETSSVAAGASSSWMPFFRLSSRRIFAFHCSNSATEPGMLIPPLLSSRGSLIIHSGLLSSKVESRRSRLKSPRCRRPAPNSPLSRLLPEPIPPDFHVYFEEAAVKVSWPFRSLLRSERLEMTDDWSSMAHSSFWKSGTLGLSRRLIMNSGE